MAEVRTVAVIGAGTMGRGIAQVAALAGYAVKLHDVSADALDRAGKAIEVSLKRGVEVGKVAAEAADAARGRISAGVDLEACARPADLVIEAATEDIAVKIDLFGRLDKVCRPGVVLATNTSALSVTEIAAATGRQDEVVGMHFFNPVPVMRLVEVVRGLETSPGTLATSAAVARQMGKEPVTVNESPGFVTTRINAMIGNEAFYMLQEGVASAQDIDRALKLGLNHPMGPFELVDLVGLDVRLRILEYLHGALGEKFRPCPLLAQYVRGGRLGRKVGRGVYEYKPDGTRAG